MKIEPTDKDTIVRVEQRAFEQFMRFRAALVVLQEDGVLDDYDDVELGLIADDYDDLAGA